MYLRDVESYVSTFKGGKMKRLIIILILFICNPVSGGQKLMVLTEDWPPFNYKENNRIVGISTDLVIAALNKAGLEYTLHLYPWKRAYQVTRDATNTLLFTTSRTKKRETLFKWIGPLFSRKIVMYKLKSRNDIHINSLEDLKKYQLGILRGGSVEEYLRTKGFQNQVHYQCVAKEKQNILKLFANRIDMIPGSDMSMAFRMKNTPYKFSDLQSAFVLIDEGGYYVAINNKTSDTIVNRIQTAFDQLVHDGLRQKIVQKYLE